MGIKSVILSTRDDDTNPVLEEMHALRLFICVFAMQESHSVMYSTLWNSSSGL